MYSPESSDNHTHILTLACFERDVSEEKRDKNGKWTKGGSEEMTAEESEQFFKDHESTQKLTEPQVAAATAWTEGRVFRQLNEAARKGDASGLSKDLQQHYLQLKRLLDSQKFSRDVTLFRGVDDPDGAIRAQLAPGSVFEEKGFAATSTNSQVSQMFGSLVMEIHAKTGQKGFPIRKYASIPEQDEVLLPKGSKFKVKRVRTEGQTTVAEVEYLDG